VTQHKFIPPEELEGNPRNDATLPNPAVSTTSFHSRRAVKIPAAPLKSVVPSRQDESGGRRPPFVGLPELHDAIEANSDRTVVVCIGTPKLTPQAAQRFVVIEIAILLGFLHACVYPVAAHPAEIGFRGIRRSERLAALPADLCLWHEEPSYWVRARMMRQANRGRPSAPAAWSPRHDHGCRMIFRACDGDVYRKSGADPPTCLATNWLQGAGILSTDHCLGEVSVKTGHAQSRRWSVLLDHSVHVQGSHGDAEHGGSA
jgi:hypothetical protein